MPLAKEAREERGEAQTHGAQDVLPRSHTLGPSLIPAVDVVVVVVIPDTSLEANEADDCTISIGGGVTKEIDCSS